MEKIKQAVEKARQERQEAGIRTGPGAAAKAAKPSVPFDYSKTRTLEGSHQLMLENRLVSAMDHGEYTDAMKMLSTQVLQRMQENHWGSVAVTSPRHGEGKTTIAINLGISIAREIEYTVLVVDANMRNPRIHEYFGITPEFGLGDYLTSDIDLSDILVKPKGIGHFVILPGGKPLMSSTEMLGSPKMCSLAEELTNRYSKRIIIYDLPPILTTADTLAFLPCVDAALVVVEDDETKEDDLKSSVDMLSVTNVIGTVLNKSRYGA